MDSLSVALLAVLLCATGGCAALAAAGRKRPVRREQSWFLWTLAFSLAAFLFALTWLVTVPEYMTNDDVFFLRAIAEVPEKGLSAVTNTLAHSAQEGTESMSILLCAVIGFFYNFDPDGYWYLGYHVFILLASLTVIFRCILEKLRRRGKKLRAGCILCFVLFAGVFMYAWAEISFTVTAAMAGTAAVSLVLARGDRDARSWRIFCDAGSVLLILLCWLQRRATGMCLLCFWLLAAAYQTAKILLSGRENRRSGTLRFAAVIAAGLALVFICDAAGQSVSDPEYHRAEYYRSLIVDYLNDDLTAEEYARAGIPQELATMIHGWYFMDERVTTDMFEELSEIYYADQAAAKAETSLSQRLFSPFASLFESVLADGQMLCRAGVCLCLLLLCIAAFFRAGRRCWPELITAVCAFGGAGLLLLQLASGGRFLLRVFLVVIFPAIATLLMALLSMPDPPEGESPRRRGVFTAVCAVLSLAGTVCCVRGAYLVPHIADAAEREDVFADQWAIEDYANGHKDTSIITSIYDYVFDPLHPLETYPTNTILWGACGDTYREDRLYADTFFREDVAFMSDSLASAPLLLQYLSVEHGPVQARITEQITSSIAVYDIDQVTPGENYTGWYEQNGLTYYFENGRAVTGTKTIGGLEYEFAPAGANASFLRTETADGQTLYTTYAYSLVPDE